MRRSEGSTSPGGSVRPQRAVVVGGTRGIGREIARELRERGVDDVIVVGRDVAVGERTASELGVRFVACDVSLMREVAKLGGALRQAGPLDLLVHSADVLRTARYETSEGLEISFATNYLSRALLNEQLEPALLRAAAPVVIHVAAAGMPGTLKLEELPPVAPASSFTGHNVGQRANDVYGLELARRLAAVGGRVLVFNPGLVDTDIRRRGEGPWWVRRLAAVLEALIPKTRAEDIAAVILRAALDDRAESGLYDPRGRRLIERGFRADPGFRAAAWERTHAALRAVVPAA